MPKLRHLTTENNQKVNLTDDGDTITTLGGLLTVYRFCEQSGIFQNLAETIEFVDYRKNPCYSNMLLLKEYLLQTIAGYLTDSAVNSLRHDPMFRLLFGQELHTQPTSSRFLQRISDLHTLKTLHTGMENIAVDYLNQTPSSPLILDVDSTESETFGHQEGAKNNPHYGGRGMNPWMTTEAMSGGLLVDAQLRSGDTYTSTEAAAFLAEDLSRLASHPLVIRGDSGFAVPAIYDLVEDRNKFYVVRLKANNRLLALGQQNYEHDPVVDPKEVNDAHYYTVSYRARSWRESRKVIIMASRNQELLPQYQYFVTNLPLTPQDIVAAYHQRGTMENYIKEAKGGYGFTRTNSTGFFVNEARMVLAGTAYNIMRRMALDVLPKREQKKTINTIRLDLLRIGARFTSHSGVITIHYTTSNPMNDLFWEVYDNIESMIPGSAPPTKHCA